jgi:hypothetical protein
MQKVGFIQVTEWAPDSVEWDVPLLEECKGYLPIYGGLRSVKVHKDIAEQALANSIVTGAHAHLITSGQLDEIIIPSSIDTNLLGVYFDRDLTDTYTDTTILGGKNPDDETYLRYRQSTDPGAGIEYIMPLSDPTHAVDGTATWTFFIRYRTTSGFTNWTLDAKWQEFDGGTWNDVSAITQETGSTAQTGWTTVSKTAAAPAPTDADDLRVVVSLRSTDEFEYIYDAPTSDEEVNGEWVNEAGGTVLYTSVDDAFGSGWGVGADATYIESPPVAAGTVDTGNFIILGLPTLEDLRNLEGNITFSSVWRRFNIRARHTGSSGNFKIYQDIIDLRTGEQLVGADLAAPATGKSFDDQPTVSTVTSSFANYDGGIVAATRQFVEEEDRENLGVKIWVENVDVADVADTDNYPTGSTNTDNWSFTGATLHASLGNNTKNASLLTDDKNKGFIAKFGAITEPEDHTKTKIKIKLKGSTGGSGCSIKVKDETGSGSSVGSVSCQQTSFATKVITLTSTESSALNWSNLQLNIQTKNNLSVENTYTIQKIWIEVPGNTAKVQISAFASEAPGCHGFDISWNVLQTIADTTATPTDGDLNRLFFGTLTKMHMWDESAISQFPNTFGAGTYPMSWDFASFGGDVYMTNFAERPLVWTPSSPSTLGNAHTAGDIVSDITTFKYKFVESVGDHLVVANINHADYEAYTVCFSHFNDPTSFSAGDVGLTQTPGEITGLVGGEYGLVFKRNSIYRMSYVGPDVIFRFDLVSRSIGTPFGKSIVRVGADVYFYTDSGFYVMRGGSYPQRIGDGKITKYFTDVIYSDDPIAPQSSKLPTANDNNIVGAYDRITGLVIWIYRSKNDAVDEDNATWNLNHFVFYNPAEDRWGRVEFSDLNTSRQVGDDTSGPVPTDLQQIATLLNHGTEIDSLTRGVMLLARYDTTTDEIWLESLRGDASSSSEITTKRLSSRSLREEGNVRVVITSIRPYIHGEPVADYDPDLTFTISSYANPTTNTTEDTSVATNTNIGDDGWYELDPITCEYFTIKMENDASVSSSGVKNISGFDVRYYPDGEY